MAYKLFLAQAHKIIMRGQKFNSLVRLINDQGDEVQEIRSRLIIAASLCGYASLKMAYNTDPFKLIDYFGRGYLTLDLDTFWQMGKPRRAGWFVMLTTTGDVVMVKIEKDSTAEGKKYLRINEDGDSRPLKEYQWCVANYGPIPMPPVIRKSK